MQKINHVLPALLTNVVNFVLPWVASQHIMICGPNPQSCQTIDCVIGNPHFGLSVECLLLRWWKHGNCITKYTRLTIFRVSEPPQYIVVGPTDCEMKDINWYRNKYLPIKNLKSTAFFEKCGCLFAAIYLHLLSKRIFRISKRNL